METQTLYKIIRFYEDGGKYLLQTHLTLEEAQARCKDPDGSSETCTSREGVLRTATRGRWFEGYEAM